MTEQDEFKALMRLVHREHKVLVDDVKSYKAAQASHIVLAEEGTLLAQLEKEMIANCAKSGHVDNGGFMYGFCKECGVLLG